MIPYLTKVPAWDLIIIFPMGKELRPSQLRQIDINQLAMEEKSVCIAAIPGINNVLANCDRDFLKVCLPQWDVDLGEARHVLLSLGFDAEAKQIFKIELVGNAMLPMLIKTLMPLWRISKDSTETSNKTKDFSSIFSNVS